MRASLQSARLGDVIQRADQREKVCVSNIDTHGLGTHAAGTIPTTRQSEMPSFCILTEAKAKLLRTVGEELM